MGKGSKPRPQTVSREELDLRWDYSQGKISLVTFNQSFRKLKKKGLIQRSGRVLK